MSKSHVSMETNACVVCGQEYDTGGVLLDTRIVNGKLRESMEQKPCTGWGMCEEHEKLRADGYIALVSCDEKKSGAEGKERVQLDAAYRLGEIVHVRASAWGKVFNVPAPEHGVTFCGPDVIALLMAIPVKD